MAAPAAEPLSAGQVAAALSFYQRQPWLYTAAVIRDLRTKLGLDSAGGVDADLVQAVARFQRDDGGADPALRVDGMAGPRTMPRLLPAGLARAGEGAKFGGEAQTGTFDQWDTLGSAKARADALVEAVNRRLSNAGVPAVTSILYDGASPNEQGSFDFPSWSLRLNRLLLDQSGLPQKAAADLAETLYHEARHAEQWFWMARYLAGRGYSAAGIAGTLGIPGTIGKAAKGAPPIQPGSTDAVIASGWYESVYGSGAAHRDAVLERLAEADWSVTTAKCRCQRAPGPASDALLAKAEAALAIAFDAYQQLPEENDAFATEPTAGAGVTGGTPHPTPVPDVDPCEQLRRAGRPVPTAAPGGGP